MYENLPQGLQPEWASHIPIFHAILDTLKPSFVMELGTGRYSAWVLSQCPPKKIVSIDHDQAWLDKAKEFYTELEAELYHYPFAAHQYGNNYIREIRKYVQFCTSKMHGGHPAILFVDQCAGLRIHAIRELAPFFDAVIYHDTDFGDGPWPAQTFGYEHIPQVLSREWVHVHTDMKPATGGTIQYSTGFSVKKTFTKPDYADTLSIIEAKYKEYAFAYAAKLGKPLKEALFDRNGAGVLYNRQSDMTLPPIYTRPFAYEDLLIAMVTVDRTRLGKDRINYLNQTLDDMIAKDHRLAKTKLRLIVGDEGGAYIDEACAKSPHIIPEYMNARESADMAALSIWNRLTYNQSRALDIAAREGYRGVIVLEDDLLFRKDWIYYAMQAIQELRTSVGSAVLSLASPHNFINTGALYRGPRHIGYERAYWGNQAYFVDAAVCRPLSRHLRRYEQPADCAIGTYGFQNWNLYTVLQALVQHVGVLSTGVSQNNNNSVAATSFPSFNDKLQLFDSSWMASDYPEPLEHD